MSRPLPMRIGGVQSNVKYRAIEIYVSGCRAPHCDGCHNPQLWDFAAGRPFDEGRLAEEIDRRRRILPFLRNIWILGGEPTHQPKDDLRRLVLLARKAAGQDGYVMLFTRLDELPETEAFQAGDYVKMGPYDRTRPPTEPIVFRDGEPPIVLASDNQRIVALRRDA